MQHFSDFETQMIGSGPSGDIEMVTTVPLQPVGVTVIICHPHPLFGGTMHNKVVTVMARTFHDHGLSTVRFNFRGVGRSSGVHDQGIGETDDVIAIAEDIILKRPHDQLWLAGFSFGGFVAANAAAKLPSVTRLITIAPQVSRFETVPLLHIPWLVIQGDQDDVVPYQEVSEWVLNQQPTPELVTIQGASHFFHGRLKDLREALEKACFK